MSRPRPSASWLLSVAVSALPEHRRESSSPSIPAAVLFAVLLVLTPAAVYFVPTFVAGRGSLRSGLRAAAWAVAAAVPLTYAVWLPEALHRHGIDGYTLDGESLAPVGTNLSDALAFCLGIFPILGLALGVIGAAAGARRGVPTSSR
jgi:hypothetical protein